MGSGWLGQAEKGLLKAMIGQLEFRFRRERLMSALIEKCATSLPPRVDAAGPVFGDCFEVIERGVRFP